jgi:thymidylate kinase
MPGAEGPARLVAVEGIDGSGKTTVARRLVRALADAGDDAVLVSRETVADGLDDYRASHLRAIRGLIWDYPHEARTSELGFAHWRHLLAAWFAAVDHTVVEPALERGAYVVADSWYFKFVARFAVAVGLPQALDAFAEISEPDIVLWLDTPPEVCLRRRPELRSTESGEWTGEGDGAEGFLSYQSAVRGTYRRLAGARSWTVVASADGTDLAVASVLGALVPERVAS